MFRIVSADPKQVEHGLGVEITMPAVAVLGFDGDRLVGSGGLAWGGGRAWIWFKMLESKPSYAVPIVRATRKMLRRAVQLGECEVFTPRDASEPMSLKLLTMLGFERQGDEGGIEVWKWVNG
jgi:hypothetical protein